MKEKNSDLALVSRFQNGQEDAFLELVERYTQKVHNLALRITRNADDTEEILQDVFITVYNKIHTFQGKAAFSSWLYRITANTAFMKLRTRKKHLASSLEDLREGFQMGSLSTERSDTHDVGYLSARHELRELIERAVAALPSEYREIFVLRDVDGLSNQEVGDQLGISVPAVKSRLHRSRMILRKKLKAYYEDYTCDERIHHGSQFLPSLRVEHADSV